ncbi:hypothetical protein ACQEVX_05135 [Streptomyces syringium]|uniref:hypothetical protein n=1 Tax=Streptomyces syringium TaxID=76729 RepID=UPI003D91762C
MSTPGGVPLVRPFIARTTGEPFPDLGDVISCDGRVAYGDETPADRDTHGVLWARQAHRPDEGLPLFGKIHSARQRHAMLHLLCQVCGQEPDENADGLLWLLPTLPGQPPDDDGDGIITTYPPVCWPCADLALRQCPPLRRAHAALRVQDVQVHGVSGAAYTLTGPTATFRAAVDCIYGSPALATVVATQQLLRLTHYCDDAR